MPTLADSLVSSASRPLPLRVRPDLTAQAQRYHGQTYWVLKEPVGLNYFRFHDEEYAILNMLDGRSSLESIKERFEREFAPQKITLQDLQQFVGMLHRSGLVISESGGQGRELKRRRDEKKRRELLGKVSNVFALRFRGIDPERLLNWMHPYIGWLFTPAAMMFVLTLGLCALSLVIVQFDVFRSRLPTFHEFFGPSNWIYLGVTLGIVKVLHEFGHGLSCKHYGGECHEMGFMLLVFTPCLYCNVSDSWMLPSKWKRMFIGAAGMYVEVFLASIATFLWWFSEPGLLNHISLSVMFICSVSTLMFNGNPLLRFDGYYILMDYLEIPNLRQKSTEILKRFLVWLCLGIEQPENPFLPENNRFMFGLYTVAAVMYRWVVVLSILYFLNKVLEPYGLKILGQLIAAVGLFGLIVQPLWQLGKFFYVPGRMNKVKKYRLGLTVAALAAVVGVVGFVPFPYQVDASFTVEPRGAAAIYPSTPGNLTDVKVGPGHLVNKGDVLARVDSTELQLAVLRLEGEQEVLEKQLGNLRKQRFYDDRVGRQIPQVNEMLKTVEEQLREKRAELDRLTIIAPVDGTILPPPPRPEQQSEDGRLPQWHGQLLDTRNAGALVAPTDLICHIGDPARLEAVLIIDQSQIPFVKPGQKVQLQLDAYPGTTLETEIEKIAADPIQVLPASLSMQAGGRVETVNDPSGAVRPISTSYPARAPLKSDLPLTLGLRGQAKVKVASQTLAMRLLRYLSKTFHFDL